MAQTKPKTDSRQKNKTRTFSHWVVVALVTGKNGRTYVIQKRRSGEWRCNCRTPHSVCQHMKRAWLVGGKGESDNGVAIEMQGAF